MEEGIDEKIIKTWEYLSGRRQDIEDNNHRFSDPEFMTLLEEIFSKSTMIVPKGQILYRSRIYTAPDKEMKKRGAPTGEVFEGYNAAESFVNLSRRPSAQRMNLEGISVLYAASDIETTAKELHPGIGELLSVAKIISKTGLKIADLSTCTSGLCNTRDLALLSIYIQEMITQGNSAEDYIFPQFIASYCQSLGFDGIGYRSKYASRNERIKHKNGINYAIFNYKKCEVISSKLYWITNISTSIQPLYDHMAKHEDTEWKEKLQK